MPPKMIFNKSDIIDSSLKIFIVWIIWQIMMRWSLNYKGDCNV